jgi:hypothetical protein
MARPRVELTPKDLRQVEALAGLGLTQKQIASALGFSERTFRNKKAIDDEVFAAWERGKLKAKMSVSAVAFRNALDGDQRAVEYYEATRFGITMKSGEAGASGDRTAEEDAALADPHDELLRRYDEIALRQAESEMPEPGEPMDHNPLGDAHPRDGGLGA